MKRSVVSRRRPCVQLLSEDREWRKAMATGLAIQGYQVSESLPAAAPEGAEAAAFDLVVGDLGDQPLVQLVRQCRELRQRHAAPLLVLAGCEDETAHIMCLELGADDFLPRSASAALLAVRARILLRHCSGIRPTVAGRLRVDPERREVRQGEKRITLTTMEFELLWLMARNAGKILPRERIHREIFSSEYNGLDRSVDIYVSKLRKKIGDENGGGQMIKTIRGTGYMLVR